MIRKRVPLGALYYGTERKPDIVGWVVVTAAVVLIFSVIAAIAWFVP